MTHLTSPFRVDDTHCVLGQDKAQCNASSNGLNWTALYASAQSETPYEGFFPAVKDQLIVLHRTGPAAIARMEGSRSVQHVIPAGGVHLVPGNMAFGFRLLDPLHTLHVYIRQAIIEEVAAEMVEGDPSRIVIPPLFVDEDPRLAHLLSAIMVALEEPDYASSLYVEYLARAIAAQLIRGHSQAPIRAFASPEITGTASALIAEAIDFMQENLNCSIGLVDIAKAIRRSPSHFARQFRSEIGTPPYNYLIKLRIEKARQLLERTRTSIAEVAFECGFSHQEHLTRFFQQRMGTTPAAYRRSKQN